MKVREVLCFHAGLNNVRRAATRWVDAWLERFGAGGLGGKKTRRCAGPRAWRKKFQFIATIPSPPGNSVILDEPFSGLDPVNADLIRDTILEIKAARGLRTIIFFDARHGPSPNGLCDFIFMIFKGRKVLRRQPDGHPGACTANRSAHVRLADPEDGRWPGSSASI